MYGLAQIGAGAGADPDAFVDRIADDLCLRSFDEAREKVGIDRGLHDEAFGRDAALTVVLEARRDGGRRRGIEIGVGKDDEGV